MSRLTLWAGSLLVLVLGIGCAHRVVRPPPPVTLPRAPDLANTDLYLASFAVEQPSVVDGDEEILALQTAFIQYVTAASQVRSLHPRSDFGTLDAKSSLVLDVRVRPSSYLRSTVVLDMLSIFSLGLVTPWWGRAAVEMEVTVSDARGRQLATYQRKAYEECWNFWFSWWRTQFVEDAYRDAYQAVLASLAFEMAKDSIRLSSAIGATRPEIEEKLIDTTGAWQSEIDGARSWATAWEQELPEPIPRDEQFLLIREAPAPPASIWYRTLRLLGGVEVANLYGLARVSSSIQDEEGNAVEVGAGDAAQTGYRIALYTAPDSTGWFWYPTVGYLDQHIAISGFRDTLNTGREGEGILEPSCSDPNTGERVDCGAPSVYDLEMKSGYLGVRGGYELLAGNKWIQFLAAASIGVNLLEYRTLRTVVGSHDATSEKLGGLVSGAAGGTIGFKFPAIHTAVRLIFDYELYRAFEYDESVPFKGPAEWNPNTRMYERPLRFVTAATLHSWTLQGAVAVVF